MSDLERQMKEYKKKIPYYSEWVRIKSNRVYRAIANVIIEDTLEPAVVYYLLYDSPHLTWVRPTKEFLSRFRPKENNESSSS